MCKQILRATHQGILTIGEKDLSCAVLEDGSRVLFASSIFKAFNRTQKGNQNKLTKMPSFIDAKNLECYFDKGFMEVIETINYIGKSGKELKGYKAELLPVLCNVYLQARQDGALRLRQQHFAVASEILVRSLAKVGIIALVDEATGYQVDRDKEALQKLLAMYVSTELLPWTKTFQDEFYEEMFRLRGWSYKPLKLPSKKPGVVGTWTNKLIYEKLPPGILEELKKNTPKSEKGNYTKRFHQSLTPDIGHVSLQKHIAVVVSLMRISKDWKQFIGFFNRNFGGQLDLLEDELE